MAEVVLDQRESSSLTADEVAATRVHVSAAAERAAAVREDELLTKQDIMIHPKEVAGERLTELENLLDNESFADELLSRAAEVVTSRCVYKWKFAKDASGKEQNIIRLRFVLRGFMDQGAFPVKTFSGAARGQSRRALASEAARRDDSVIASLGVDEAFVEGLAYADPAAGTGEQ